MTEEQPKKEYVVVEMSLKWQSFETRVMTKQELEKIMIDKLYHKVKVVEIYSDYFDEHIYDLVEVGHESVFHDASTGIVSVVRLSDGKVWGERGERK